MSIFENIFYDLLEYYIKLTIINFVMSYIVNFLDLFVVLLFFFILIFISYFSSKNVSGSESFLINDRKTGLFLFISTNVATWYGGILGVGEFTYNYGIINWVTQGLPYYFFAILFALLFASKVREASLYTLPEKMDKEYGRKVSILTSIIVLILSSPAPYILMLGIIVSNFFSINFFISTLLSVILILPFIIKGGFVTDLKTDLFQFFIMYAGFILLFIFSLKNIGGISILQKNLPSSHLSPTGGLSPFYIVVWYFIAAWTFVDPGFHQRCYSAKNGNIAKKGILISVLLWIIFDFLTTITALYAKVYNPDLKTPQWAYFSLASDIMPQGIRGIFYSSILATVISTLNSYFVISGTTFSIDIVKKINPKINVKKWTSIGILLSGIFGIFLAFLFPSVVQLWYIIGSISIPGLIFPLIGAYYKKFKVKNNIVFFEIIFGFSTTILWILIRKIFSTNEIISMIEPMFIGLISGSIIHFYGMVKNAKKKINNY